MGLFRTFKSHRFQRPTVDYFGEAVFSVYHANVTEGRVNEGYRGGWEREQGLWIYYDIAGTG
jgi:hypothetical protein